MSEAGTNEQTAGAGPHDHRNCFCCGLNEAFEHWTRRRGGSEQVKEHFRQARIEFLKGVRTILDERIERLAQRGQKGTRIVVD